MQVINFSIKKWTHLVPSLPTTVTHRRYRHMEIHSPVAHPAPPRIRSPAVPSTNRCEGKDAEESRQQLASRCTIQLVNVALLLTSVLLRRMISKAEPRAGDPAEETIAQKVERHTGVLFTRVHARYFFEVVATSLGIPCLVLDAVLGVTNSAGAMHDGQGLLLVGIGVFFDTRKGQFRYKISLYIIIYHVAIMIYHCVSSSVS